MNMALPRPLEAALQQLERRGREVSGKIEEAAEAVIHDWDDLDDPSILREAHELAQVVRGVTTPREPAAASSVAAVPAVRRLPSRG